MLTFRTLPLFAVVAACAAHAAPPVTPPGPHPITFGETFTLDSYVLGERRVINVYLPPDYAKSTDRYAVLYMPDGGMAEDFPQITGIVDVSIKDAVIRPVIVVGIENTERRRDLVGPTMVAKERAIAPHAGGSDRFRQFLRDELKPYIASHYRTTAESALIGESLAGLFVLETLLADPSLFDAYIAVDPSVWWNDQALVHTADARFSSWSASPKRVFIATADNHDSQDGVAILRDALDRLHPAGLTATFIALPEEHHNTIFPFAALKSLRPLFALPH